MFQGVVGKFLERTLTEFTFETKINAKRHVGYRSSKTVQVGCFSSGGFELV